ncbi:hypothetical protein C1645_877267 [Glomus cerebriforme]|uniref:F-box domain-containing protein n=1 Tax=Glomus cerebriforme TaxID=658196 RepID=A0A397SVG0_9GLOM|nr:hypothetical protein C1645_877267 [Glomus cerebriforme]
MKSNVPVEILQNIFEIYNHDIKSLHSTLLVNRYWARVVVCILWRYPLEFASTFTDSNCVSKKLLDVYRRCIKSEELLFDYPTFLKRLNWKYLKYEHDGKQIFQMLLQKSKCLTHLTIDSYNNHIGIYENFDIILNEEILQNPFLKKIKILEISDLIPKNLLILSKSCNYIETLTIECVGENQEIFHFIQFQYNLKNLFILYSFPSFKNSLNFNPHLLTNIKFINRNDHYFNHSLDILKVCSKLENLEFYKWNILLNESQEFSKIHFSNLKSLKFEYSELPFTTLKEIIEINGSNLKELLFIYENYNVYELELLSESICKSCRLSFLTLQVYRDNSGKCRNFIKNLEKSPINIVTILDVLNR